MYSVYRTCFLLDGGLVWDRCNDFWEVAGGADSAGFTGLDWLPLQVHVLASSLCRPLLLSVGLYTVDELLSALGVLDVLNADVHSLLDVSVSDKLVEDNSEGGLGDVVHNTGLSVVDLVGHTMVKRSIRCCRTPIRETENKLTPSERHHLP